MGKLFNHKGLLFSTMGLVVFFLVYLLVNVVVQSNSSKSTAYAERMSSVATLLESIPSSNQASFIKDQLMLFKDGGIQELNGNKVEFDPIDNFLAPDVSDIQSLIDKVNTANFSAAKTEVATLAAKVASTKDRKLKLAKYLQFAAAFISLLIYCLVVLPFIARLSQQKETEQEVQRETTGIMSTVSEGLFLLDHDYTIGVEQSASLKEMFKSERDLVGNFFDFIGQYVPQNTIQIAKDYMDLLLADRVKEKLVQDLNPLNEVEINIVRRDGSFENRYLDFGFNRVMQEDGRLSHLLGSVTDVTRRVTLERQLVESKEEQEAQLELLMSILHVDNEQLEGFFNVAENSLTEMNETLESRGYGNREIRTKIADISRNVHRLKGDAAALGLHKFEFTAHAFEDELDRVTKENEKITGKELLPAVTHFKELYGELNNMRSLVNKFSTAFAANAGQAQSIDSIVASDDADSATSTTDVVAQNIPQNSLQQLVSTICERTNKRASLMTYGMHDGSIPESLEDSVNSIAVQLIRNSIVHGCLLPEERIALNKSDFMNITSSFTETDEKYELTVRDDGEGFDDQKIIQRAIDLGMIDADKAKRLNENQAIRFAFKPGFSSLDKAEMDGGRGVGLDVVHNMAKELGGMVYVQYKKGIYCQFRVDIPKKD